MVLRGPPGFPVLGMDGRETVVLQMIQPDGSQSYPEGRQDCLHWEWPDGERWYYEGRPDFLYWEWPDGRRWYQLTKRSYLWYNPIKEIDMTDQVIRRTDAQGNLYDPIDPAIEYLDGAQFFYKRPGQLHNPEGWASKYSDGTLIWAQNGRIHRTNGPAIVPPDAPPQYWLNGNKVPDWIVTNPERITAKDILSGGNTDLAAAMLSLMSVDKLLADLEPTLLDSDPIIGQLYSADVGQREPIVFLIDDDPSLVGKRVILPVDPTVKTCLEAQTWLIEIPPGMEDAIELGNMIWES